jgi:hypothetical protein
MKMKAKWFHRWHWPHFRWGRWLLVCFFVVSSMMTTMGVLPFPAHSPAHAISGIPVIALYQTSYEMGNWNYDTISDIPAPRYNGSDSDAMRRHIIQAYYAGINTFLCVWHGPDEERRDSRCKRLQKRIIEIREDTGEPADMRIAFLIDLGSEENPEIRTRDGIDEALRKLHEESIYIHNSHYMSFAGKPAIFWLNPNYYGSVAEWHQLRNELDPDRSQFWFATTDIPNFQDGIFGYLDVFDAVFRYDITRDGTPADAMATYNQRLQQYNRSRGAGKPFIATVMPGYDNTRGSGNDHYRDRQNGAYYRQSWQAAIPYAPAAVVLNSFNGFREGTHIEPSEQYGDQYLNLTGALIGEFRQRVPTPSADLKYYPQTGHFLRGAFRWFWENHGGVARFGYPATEEFIRKDDGRIVQYFERARLEMAPGSEASAIELGLLGIEYKELFGLDFPRVAPFARSAGRLFFRDPTDPDTHQGYSLQGAFKAYWEAHSGIRSYGYPKFFGYPISQEIGVEFPDGSTRLVQYFERVRLELHGSQVYVGLLGTELAPCHHRAPRPPDNPPSPHDILPEGDNDPCPTGYAPKPASGSASSGDAASSGGSGSSAASGIYISPLDPGALLDRINRGIPTGRVYHQNVAPGTVQGFEAWHYAPGEQVSLWLNLPDGNTTRSLPYLAEANNQGYVLIGFQTKRTDPEGDWSLVGQGLQSGRAIVAPFRLQW